MKRFIPNGFVWKILAIVTAAFFITACGKKFVPEPLPEDKGKLVEFLYDFGSFNSGYRSYHIFEENGQLTLNAEGGNGVELNAKGPVPDTALDEITDIIAEYNIEEWNGFNDSDSDILDGYHFSLKGIYENGMLSANGYMMYPPDYDTAHEALFAYLDELANEIS